jgi:hypothetical protein
MFSPEVNIISQIYKDPWIQNHCELGKTVLVRGVDKPRIIYENNQWKLVFLDVQCQTLHAPWRKSHDALNYEFFYWSSDLPQIMSKQAHLIKNFFQSWDTESIEFKEIFSRQNHLFSRKKYVEWIDPIIYSAYLLSIYLSNYISFPYYFSPRCMFLFFLSASPCCPSLFRALHHISDDMPSPGAAAVHLGLSRRTRTLSTREQPSSRGRCNRTRSSTTDTWETSLTSPRASGAQTKRE